MLAGDLSFGGWRVTCISFQVLLPVLMISGIVGRSPAQTGENESHNSLKLGRSLLLPSVVGWCSCMGMLQASRGALFFGNAFFFWALCKTIADANFVLLSHVYIEKILLRGASLEAISTPHLCQLCCSPGPGSARVVVNRGQRRRTASSTLLPSPPPSSSRKLPQAKAAVCYVYSSL